MSRLQKLARMGPSEVAERVGQALALRRDRTLGSARTRSPSGQAFLARHLEGSPRSAAQLLERFQERPPRFFPGLDDPAASAAALERARPGSGARAVAEAEDVLEGRIRLFDRVWSFDPVPDWSYEPLSGLRYRSDHWSRIDYLDPRVGGEYKLVWELARHQHFLTLARAAAVSGEERWADACLEHLVDWIERNPPGRGIHWASSLELAFRIQSWLWALHAFRHSPALTPDRFLTVLRSIETHGLHIDRYFSTYYSPNTHLTGEALALYTIGVALPELRRAERWRARGRSVLEDWADTHIREDGTYFEQSTAYQRYTVDFYHQWAILGAHCDGPPPTRVLARLDAAVDHLARITLPSGCIPLLGDDDGGRTWPLDERRRADVRPALATGAVRAGRPDWKAVAGDAVDEVAWLLGPEGLDRYVALPSTKARGGAHAYPDGGLYLSTSDGPDHADYVLIDCGPHGAFNCGHAHADLLSVVVALTGHEVLVDPGTFTYSSLPERRDHYRSAIAHNTVTVDDQGPSTPGSAFHWTRIVHGTGAQWQAWEDARAFLGGHQGFPGGGGHRRALVHLPGVLVAWSDTITGAPDAAPSVARLHLAAGATAALTENGVEVAGRARISLLGQAGSPSLLADRVSPSYRSELDATTLEIPMGAAPLLTVVTPPGPEPLRRSGAFELPLSGGAGSVMVAAGPCALPDLQVESDGDLLCLRLRDGTPIEILAVGATRLTHRGRSLLATATPGIARLPL
ncbi:MAG: alginate lyase family protein [Gemmatimonadota bacterium]